MLLRESLQKRLKFYHSKRGGDSEYCLERVWPRGRENISRHEALTTYDLKGTIPLERTVEISVVTLASYGLKIPSPRVIQTETCIKGRVDFAAKWNMYTWLLFFGPNFIPFASSFHEYGGSEVNALENGLVVIQAMGTSPLMGTVPWARNWRSSARVLGFFFRLSHDRSGRRQVFFNWSLAHSCFSSYYS